MVELLRLSDPVLLQVLADALTDRAIDFRIENAGMNALLPLPSVMDARVLVAGADLVAAERIVRDLELDR